MNAFCSIATTGPVFLSLGLALLVFSPESRAELDDAVTEEIAEWLVADAEAPASEPASEPAEIEAASEETAAAQIPGDPVAQSYMMKCLACHSIGGGALSGPDLKPVSGWPRPQLREAIVRMEKNVGPMTEEEIDGYTDFLLDPQAAARLERERERRALVEAATLEPASAELGERLFHGTVPFANGGISCAACHQAGGRGGNVASSLEDAFTRLGKEPLMSACLNPGFPVMRAMYTPKPIQRQEAVHMVKYLETVAEDPQDEQFVPLYAMGFAGACLVMAGIGRGHENRLLGTRARLVARAHNKDTRDSAGS